MCTVRGFDTHEALTLRGTDPPLLLLEPVPTDCEQLFTTLILISFWTFHYNFYTKIVPASEPSVRRNSYSNNSTVAFSNLHVISVLVIKESKYEQKV
jgi:hypothetical protein